MRKFSQFCRDAAEALKVADHNTYTAESTNQADVYSCGLHVIANAVKAANHYLSGGTFNTVPLLNIADDVRPLPNKMKESINGMMEIDETTTSNENLRTQQQLVLFRDGTTSPVDNEVMCSTIGPSIISHIQSSPAPDNVAATDKYR